MRRVVIWQYVLIGLAWALLFAAWPLRGAELNGFLGWNGSETTPGFIEFLLNQPRMIVQDLQGGSPFIGRPSIVHLAWLAGVMVGLVLYLFSPTMVRRKNLWRRSGRVAIRALSLTLMALPLAVAAPAEWHLPQPFIGLYVLALGNLLIMMALMMTPVQETEGTAFPVEGRKD